MRILVVFVVVAAIAAGAVVGWSGKFGNVAGEWLFRQAIEYQLGRTVADGRPDGLLLGVCGAGGPLANPSRTGPCLVVRAGNQAYVVDAGNNAARNLALMQFPFSEIQGVLLTHFHSDHIDGLGELMLQRWIAGGWKHPLPVYGPEGVGQVVQGFNEAYRLDANYRTLHHGRQIAPLSGSGGTPRRAITSEREDASRVLIDKNGLRITVFRVDHHPVDQAVGYRFDYKGRSLLISGDTSKSKSLIQQAQGVDLLVHEAQSLEMVNIIGEVGQAKGISNIAKIMADIPSYHTTPEEAAEIASEAGASHLLLYHLTPPILTRIFNRAFVKDAAAKFSGPIDIATDRDIYFLPVGSTDIERD